MSIKPSGNKIKFVSLMMLAIGMFMSCLPGVDDWIYDKLPNGYEIWYVNSQDIEVGKRTGSKTNRIINRYVLEFCYNESYIGIKRLPVDESLSYHDVVIEELDASNPSYYLIDAENDMIHGPYTVEEYTEQLETLHIENLCDWIKTVPKPAGARY